MTDHGSPPSRPLPRHLIDLDNPRPRQQQTGMSLSQVQRWVMSVLAVTTIAHFSPGLVLAAIFIADESRTDARIGLNVLAAGVAVCAVAAARAIHQRSILSPWLALGLVPGAVGLYLTF